MQQLEPKNIKLHAKIITPIHINNGEILDRMDYFTFTWWEEIQVLDRKWLVECGKKDKILFTKIIQSIEKWNFNKLEKLKANFYGKYGNDFITKFWVKEEIRLWNKAKDYLLQTWNKNNNWEIKRFSRFWLEKELFIPWSTLKWIFRTIYLFDEIVQWKNYKEEVKKIDNFEKDDKFKKELFAFLQFKDVNIKNLNENLEIQEINSKSKPPRFWQPPKKWISQVLEVLKSWVFEIDLLDSKWQIDINDLKRKIKKYSNTLLAREKQILGNIWFTNEFIDILDEYYKDWYFPIKIWMFKKSLSYKLFWEEMIDELNRTFKWKEWLKEAQKKWIWDKMIYLDESQNPIWWIALKFLDDNN